MVGIFSFFGAENIRDLERVRKAFAVFNSRWLEAPCFEFSCHLLYDYLILSPCFGVIFVNRSGIHCLTRIHSHTAFIGLQYTTSPNLHQTVSLAWTRRRTGTASPCQHRTAHASRLWNVPLVWVLLGPGSLLTWRGLKECMSAFMLINACHAGAKKLGLQVGSGAFFDTVRITVDNAYDIVKAAADEGVNLRPLDDKTVTVSFDETTQLADVDQLFQILNGGKSVDFSAESLAPQVRLISSTRHAVHMPAARGAA